MKNPLNIQIYGDYNHLMLYLTREIKTVFEEEEDVVLTMKIVKSDRSNYE